MSRCEHGEVISVFCVNESCTWRQAGGCQQCLKKYHSHSLSSDTLSQEKLEELFKRLLVKPEVRNKSRPLQEALYNYFMIMKSQISSSLDTVSREISNRLGYPFLYKKGYLGTFKKIKNREYKKITKSELINFYKFASDIDPNVLESQEKMLYYEEINSVQKTLSELNQTFTIYSKTISALDSTFNVEKSFYEKIKQITNLVKESKQKSTDNSKNSSITTKIEDEKALKTEQSQSKQNRFLSATLNVPKIPPKDRKISFDVHGSGENQELSKFWTGNYEQNEKQIETRKKKLLQMLDQKKKDGNPKSISQSHEIQRIRVEFDSTQKDGGTCKQSVQKQQRKFAALSAGKDIKEQEKSNLFNDLLGKGLNIPEMIAHKILPRQTSRQKLYEDTKDVKQRKITIPVPKMPQNIEEASSPLLKKRKKNQGGDLKLQAIISQEQKDESTTQPMKTPEKQDELIKDKQADSVALLIQSLTLPAEKAIPLLQAAIKHSYNNLSAAEYLSYLYLEIGKPKQCLDLCNQFLEQLEGSPHAPDMSVHISNNKAAALNMLGRYSQSISILEKCILHSQKDIYFKNLGDAYFCIGIYEKAIIFYERATTMNKELDQAIYNLAVCHYIQNHMHEAQLNIQKAIKINPKNTQYNQLHQQIRIKIQN